MQREEVVVRALVVFELDIHIHVTVGTGFAPSKRAKHTHPSRSKFAEFVKTPLDGSHWIYHAPVSLCPFKAAFKQVRQHCRRLTLQEV